MELSLYLINQAAKALGQAGLKGAIIHSDQGFHYTHPAYTRALTDLGAVQSMSRKENCLDNAPVESLFGHMKDELELTACYSLEEVRKAIADYLNTYNHRRYQ